MIEFGILVAYVAIIVMAMVPIWIGSHQSLEQKMVQSHGSTPRFANGANRDE